MLTRTLTVLTALTALTAPLTAALACAPPSEAWAIAQTWPADGAEAVAPDAPLLVQGQERDWSSFPFSDRLTVEITLDGEPVAGALADAPNAELALWWPAQPWQPGATYEARLTVENEYDDYDDTEDTRTLRFTVGDGLAPEAVAPVAEVVVEGWARELTECVEEAPIGYCGDCLERRVVGHEDRLRVRATAQAPADAATWSVRLKVAPSAALLAERGPAVARHYLGAAALSLQTDLGPWAGWPSDEVCVQAEQVDAQGRSAAGEVQCFPLERDPGMDEACGVDLESDCEDDPALDTEPAADGPGQEASLHQGCSATGAAPSAPLWLLLCLPLIRRRRR